MNVNDKDIECLASAARALADGTRLKILAILGEGEFNVTGLCERLGRRQPDVSHHLGILRGAGLVDSRRDGKCVYYRLTPTPFAPTWAIRVSVGGGITVHGS